MDLHFLTIAIHKLETNLGISISKSHKVMPSGYCFMEIFIKVTKYLHTRNLAFEDADTDTFPQKLR